MSQTADVIIVGSGVIGNAIAYNLARRGQKVLVLEKDDVIGNGGSVRNGGGVRQSGRDPRELPLAMYGIEHIWPTLSEELDADVEYYKKGNLRLGKTEKHLEILQGLTDRAVACGLGVSMIDGDEVRQINPYLSEEVIGASWCPTDGHANPMRTTLAYYRAARKLGVRFLAGEEVLYLKKIKGTLRAVVTQNDVYEADKIILACGLGARPIAASVGIDIPMNSLMLYALVTEAEPKMFEQMLGTAEADFYGHQTTHGSFIFGGTTGFEPYDPDNGMPVIASNAAPCTCRGIIKYIPKLKDAKIVRTWAGWMDYMKDGVPVIDTVDEVPGLILAAGFSGHGFGISPAVGKVVAELACDEAPSIDISGLTYDRFKAKI